MDLKGSLVDTELKIYPAENFAFMLKTIFVDEEVPVNITKFLKGNIQPVSKSGVLIVKEIDVVLNAEDYCNLNKIKTTFIDTKPSDRDNLKQSENIKTDSDKIKEGDSQCVKNKDKYVTTKDIYWLYENLKQKRAHDKNIPYIHELLQGAYIETPENETIKRNPDLEARCVKLRAQQEAREYRKMTKSVDNVRMRFPEDSIQYQLKQINRQLIAIAQFIISIFAGFLFGFKGVEWMIGYLDFGFRLLLGVICALVIALAEIYFLAKKLNEELNISESSNMYDTQKHTFGSIVKEKISKEHQD